MNLRLVRPVLLFVVVALAASALPAGASASGRITGGTKVGRDAYDAKWRSIVSIRQGFDPASPAARLDPAESRWKRDDHECGGTLIAPSWVLTAAHCVEGDDFFRIDGTGYQVLVGARRLVDGDTQLGRVVQVDDVVVHPGWSGELLDDEDVADSGSGARWDAALLHLATPVEDIPSTPIVGAGDRALWGGGAGLPTGAFVAGWGVTNATYWDYDDEVADDTQHELRETPLPLLRDDRCASSDSPIASGAFAFDSTTMICGYATGPAKLPMDRRKGACFGDSGGPLIVDDRAGGWRLAGIVSWGPDDGGGCNRASVFTRVDAVRSWIETTMARPIGAGALAAPTGVRGVVTGKHSIRVAWDAPNGTAKRLVVFRQESMFQLMQEMSDRKGIDLVRLIGASSDDEDSETSSAEIIAGLRAVKVLLPMGVAGGTSELLRFNDVAPTRPGPASGMYVRIEARGADGRRALGPVVRVATPVDSSPPTVPGRPRASTTARGLVRISWPRVRDDDCVARIALQVRRAGGRAWQTRPVPTYFECPSDLLDNMEDLLIARLGGKVPGAADVRRAAVLDTTPLRNLYRGRYAVRVVAHDRAGNRTVGTAINVRIPRRTGGGVTATATTTASHTATATPGG